MNPENDPAKAHREPNVSERASWTPPRLTRLETTAAEANFVTGSDGLYTS